MLLIIDLAAGKSRREDEKQEGHGGYVHSGPAGATGHLGGTMLHAAPAPADEAGAR
jgi:hypothetical protein